MRRTPGLPQNRRMNATPLQAECVRTLYGGAPHAVLGMLVGSTGLAVLLARHVPAAALGGWWALMLLQAVPRWWQVQRFRRLAAGLGDDGVLRWGRRFLLAHALTGLCWGSAAWWLLPAGPHEAQLLLVVALQVVCLVVLVQSAAWFAAAACLVLACQALVLARLLLHTDPAVHQLAWLVVAATLAMGVLGRRVSQVVVASIALRYENRELLGKLQARTQEAEQANLAKTRFLAMASHDLRQPLHALGLLVGALSHAGAQRPRLEAGIASAVASLQSLLGALLDISRLDAQAVRARPQPVALQPLFDRLGLEFAPVADARELQLRVRPTPLVVHADPALLERMLRNLLANALKYTERGGVLLAARARAGGVCVQVWDTGIGLDGADQQRIWGEFVQLGNPDHDRERGLGLGLSIVQRLARLQGQGLALRSVAGRGSCFAVELPRVAGGAVGAAVRAAPPAGVFPLLGRRVLVLDDEASVRHATQALLGAWGAQVDLASTLEQALAAERPDALVCDGQLDARDVAAGGSLELGPLLGSLRGRFGADLPVLVITGEVRAPDVAPGLPGVTRLHKPVEPQRLLEALQSAF